MVLPETLVFPPALSRIHTIQSPRLTKTSMIVETLSLRLWLCDYFFDPDPFHDDVLPGGIGSTSSKSIDEGLSG